MSNVDVSFERLCKRIIKITLQSVTKYLNQRVSNTQSKVVFLEILRNAEVVVKRYLKNGKRKSKLSTNTKHQIRSKRPDKKNKKVFRRRAKSGALCRIFRLNKISGKINPIVTVFSTNACGRLLSHLNTLFGGKY